MAAFDEPSTSKPGDADRRVRTGRTDPIASLTDVGIGPIRTVPSALRQCGVDPDVVLARVGIDRRLFDDPAARLPLAQVGRLLMACVDATGKPHFPLLASSRFELSMFGILGYLIGNETTVRTALQTLVLHLHLHDRGAVAALDEVDARRAGLSYAVCTPETPAVNLIDDAAIMIALRIMKALCGPDWKPVEVRLAHEPPADPRICREMFGTRVRFDAPLSTLVFDKRWLDVAITGADPDLRATLKRLLATLEDQAQIRLGDRVRRILRTSVLARSANAGSLAELLLLSERSLRRHLAREGLKLQDLINEARQLVAYQLIEHTRLPLGSIAAALSYSDPSALSRAFRGWTGQSPSEWRRTHLARHAPGKE